MSFYLNKDQRRSLTNANYQHANLTKADKLEAQIAKLEAQGNALTKQYNELVRVAYKQFESGILQDFPAKCGVEIGKAYYATPTFEGKVLRVIIQGAKLQSSYRASSDPLLVVAVIRRGGGGGISEVKELNPKVYTFVAAEEARPERVTKPPKAAKKGAKKANAKSA